MITRYSASFLVLGLVGASVGASVGVAPLSAAAVELTADQQQWVMPRTPDGHPDLQGNWSNATITPGNPLPEPMSTAIRGAAAALHAWRTARLGWTRSLPFAFTHDAVRDYSMEFSSSLLSVWNKFYEIETSLSWLCCVPKQCIEVAAAAQLLTDDNLTRVYIQ